MQLLNECAYECTKQSRWKETTQRYLANMLQNNVELQADVLAHQYHVRPTVNFTLNERGHIRQIEAPVVRDRIVQKSLMKQVLTPSLVPYLIYDNYASLTNRGTSFARKRLEVLLHRYIGNHGTDGYILLIDIRKYFASIDHDVLKQLITPRLRNEPQEVIDLIHYVIDTSSKTDKGLNLGSECPQIFAVYYLNPIDHFVKVVKGDKYYGRYMDDIFIISQSKAELLQLLEEIRQKLAEIKLDVNDTKTHIVKLKHGFTWLQVKYNITPTGKILKRMSHNKIVRERRRLKAFARQVADGQMTEQDVYDCYRSWRGTVVEDHNVCRSTIAKMDRLYHQLFPEHTDRQRETRNSIIRAANREAETEDLKYCEDTIAQTSVGIYP